MQLACQVCEDTFEAKRATAKYCSGRCRKRNQRAGGAKKAAERREASSSGVGSVAAATLLQLQEASRLHTPLGQAALALASRLDISQTDTGAGVASLAKQLEATLAAATADAEVVDDPIDELKAARERKRNAASG